MSACTDCTRFIKAALNCIIFHFILGYGFVALLQFFILSGSDDCLQFTTKICPNYIPVEARIISYDEMVDKSLANQFGGVVGIFEFQNEKIECAILDTNQDYLKPRDLYDYNALHYQVNNTISAYYDTFSEDCLTPKVVLSYAAGNRLMLLMSSSFFLIVLPSYLIFLYILNKPIQACLDSCAQINKQEKEQEMSLLVHEI